MSRITDIKKIAKNHIAKLPWVKRKREKYIEYIRGCYSYPEDVPTILAPNCIGGLIYHNLGLKFMSPTINLWMTGSDFSKFVCNLDYYLGGEMEFIESQYNYPVAKLYDIVLYFTHYKSQEEAKNKWEERKQRINRDNMYIIADDTANEEALLMLQKVKCRRLIIFSTKREGGLFFRWHGAKEEFPTYSVKNLFGFALFEKEFNYAAWLNGDEDFRMR